MFTPSLRAGTISPEAAEAFVNDPEYSPHLKARAEGSVSHHVLVEGKDALAN